MVMTANRDQDFLKLMFCHSLPLSYELGGARFLRANK